MQCKICDAQNPETNNFCGNCGTPVKEEISLRTLIEAGVVKAGDTVICKQKGKDAESTVLADGRIQHGDRIYNTPFEAIEGVRGYRCDSWTCWKHKDAEGNTHPLAAIRTALLRSRLA